MAEEQSTLVQHRVQVVLRQTETCIAAVDAKEVSTKTPVILALVTTTSLAKESALFILAETRAKSLVMSDVVPISADSSTACVSSTVVEVRFRADPAGFVDDVLRFELPDSSLLQRFVSAASRAREESLSATPGPFSHSWTKSYKIVRRSAASVAESSLSPAPAQPKIDIMPTTVFTGTWNVNGQPPPASLEPWLVRNGIKPDVYCIGFQELDLSATALVLGDSSKAAPWETAIQATLATVGDYIRLATKQLVGILLCVFVKRSLYPFIGDVQSDLMPTGVMGVMGNKGGVAVRFNLYDSTFCVVNAHLNAHVDNVTRRNQDYHDIEREIVFFRQGRRSTIWEHEFLFWIGDLNYRILGPDPDIRNRVARREWASLVANDQLKQQQQLKLAFEPFTEAPIMFAPTYKYDKDSTEYDTSAQSRAPAWCDRILWRAADPESLANIDYARHEMLSSDHRPVSAVFVIKTRAGVTAARAKAVKAEMKTQDLLENVSIPDVAFSTNEIDFGSVQYMAQQSRKLIFKNTGQVPAQWSFAAKPGEQSPFKPWLQAAPLSGVLQPGEQVAVLLAASVDRATAPTLCSGSDKLDDILLVRLEGGKDYFVSLSGRYMRSCFGMTLGLLSRYPLPVRTSGPAAGRRLRVPKELWRLVDHITHAGMDEPDLFVQAADAAEVEAVRECLDTGESFALSDFSIHAIAGAVLQFLENLSESVVPASVFERLTAGGTVTQAETKAVVNQALDADHYATFYYVLSFLRELLTHSGKNRLTPERLAVIFSGVLLRCSPGNSPSSPSAVGSSSTPLGMDPAVREKADFVIYRFLIDDSRKGQPTTQAASTASVAKVSKATPASTGRTSPTPSTK